MVKFITNKKIPHSNENPIISKTIGKTGVVSWEHVQQHNRIPKAEEFWYVEVVQEKGAGTPQGPFVLNPLEKVPINQDGAPDIIHMIPGTYKIEQVANTLLLHPDELWYPERLGPNWICGLNIKKNLMSKYRQGDHFLINSIIVVFDRTNTWEHESKTENITSTASAKHVRLNVPATQ